MLQWLDELRRAIAEEYADRSPVITLATVDRAGAPHARCVNCRRIDDEGRIFMATDARTEKNAQIRGDHRTEGVFWMPKPRVQFRLSGDTKVVAFPEEETLRKEIWRELSDEARSTYFWPTPGIAGGTDDAFAQAVAADVPPPRTFEVLILEPRHVDRLALDAHPYRRRVWRADAKWSGVDVNP